MYRPNWLFFLNEGGFGGGGKAQDVPAAPPIAPSPVPTETAPTATITGRERQVQLLKYGALSTIANSGGASGIANAGADLYPSMTGGTQGSQNRQTTGGS